MLLVSRADVNRDVIVEFDPQRRFIKLPIDNYLKLLGIYDTINRPQIALINAVNDPKYRFVCAALARRLGKTYIDFLWNFECCFHIIADLRNTLHCMLYGFHNWTHTICHHIHCFTCI